MKSLRTKLTFITICVVALTIVIVSSLSVFFIRNTEAKKSDQILLLISETGKRNLDYYFDSVQKSVDNVAKYANANFTGTDDASLESNMEDLRLYFETIAYKTNGVYTYYYRIDPEISENVKGFWYTNLDGTGFKEHEVTDITQYDTLDTSKLVWFTVPKNERKPIWIAPYITDNLDKRVISYNEPVIYRGQFIGVIGIEIDYTVLANQVNRIKVFENGYAFLSDSEGKVIYHPYIDVTTLVEPLYVPKTDLTFYKYKYNGIAKEAAWEQLLNGMRINITVPENEVEGDWQTLILNIIIVSIEVLIISSLFIMLYTRKISKPLKQLTEAAEQIDNGNFDYELKYDKDDELGRLTKTFKVLSSHMKDNISNLNKQVFVDSLTQVKNKLAFEEVKKNLDNRIIKKEQLEFSFGIFDCNDLKKINDIYGHDKGDICLKTASKCLNHIFSHVYRIGGDEFAVLLENDDYYEKDNLLEKLKKSISKINSSTENEWEKINIAYGFTSYDANNDRDADEVLRRADKLMYDDKVLKKNKK